MIKLLNCIAVVNGFMYMFKLLHSLYTLLVVVYGSILSCWILCTLCWLLFLGLCLSCLHPPRKNWGSSPSNCWVSGWWGAHTSKYIIYLPLWLASLSFDFRVRTSLFCLCARDICIVYRRSPLERIKTLFTRPPIKSHFRFFYKRN